MGGVDGGEGNDGGSGGDASCAQTSHPASLKPESDDHEKALPSGTMLGPVVPLYVSPFTISLSQQLSVVKAVALRSQPTAGLSGVIVHVWLLP